MAILALLEVARGTELIPLLCETPETGDSVRQTWVLLPPLLFFPVVWPWSRHLTLVGVIFFICKIAIMLNS